MIRRILFAGLGGVLGFILWYTLVAAHVTANASDDSIRNVIGTLLACVIASGALVMVLGEKIGLIPSQEQVEAKARPVSLFSVPDSAHLQPAPQQPANPPAPPAEPASSLSDEEIQARIAHIRATRPAPEWVYLGGGSNNLLVRQATPDAKPTMLLFSSKYAARDYLRAIHSSMEVKQIKTAQLPEAAKIWVSQGVDYFTLNCCPRCAEGVAVSTRQLSTPDDYVTIWAIDQATRWWRGQVQQARMLQYCKEKSLTKARVALEELRDHVDCGIPYVHQLIAYFADAENDTATKQAVCQELELFPAEFRWSPDYDDDNKRGPELLAKATLGLALAFPPLPAKSQSAAN